MVILIILWIVRKRKNVLKICYIFDNNKCEEEEENVINMIFSCLDVPSRVLQIDTPRIWGNVVTHNDRSNMLVFVCLIIVFVSIRPQRNEPRCWAEYLSLQSISRRCFASRLTITNQEIMIRVSLKINNTFLRPVHLTPTAHMYEESKTPIARLKTLNFEQERYSFFL